MGKKEGPRLNVKMQSTESSYFYTTEKNRRKTQTKLELKKYDPILRRHVIFREKKL